MRAHGPTHEQGSDSNVATMRSSLRTLRTLAALGAIALIATPALAAWMRRRKNQRPRACSEPAIDKSLEYTFPASDPPATRYFDIPVNRR